MKCILGRCAKIRCEKDNDCGEGEKCISSECNKFFDIKIIRADTPIKAGDALDFTYAVKNPAGDGVDVNIRYWLDGNGTRITGGNEVVFVSGGEEREFDATLNLAKGLRGKLTLFAELEYNGAASRAGKDIEVVEEAPLALDLSILRLPAVIQPEPTKLSFIVGSNSDEIVKVDVKSTVMRQGTVVWQSAESFYVKVSRRVEQNFPALEPGEYIWIIAASSGAAKARISREITVKQPEQPAQAGAVAETPTIEGILESRAVRFGASGLLLAIAAIISWHNMVIVRRIPKGHPARKRMKWFYLLVLLACFAAIAALVAWALLGQPQQLAAIWWGQFLQTEQGRQLLTYTEILQGRIGILR